jgi:prophage regulatory protein
VSNYKTLPDTGFVRLPSIIASSGPIPVSKSTWWQDVKDGRFPKPVKLGVKTTAWRVEDIHTRDPRDYQFDGGPHHPSWM